MGDWSALIASPDMISLKGFTSAALSFHFMINCHYLSLSPIQFEYTLKGTWTVEDTTECEKSRLQAFVVPKSRHYKTFVLLKSGHYKTFVVLKGRHYKTFVVLKSGHYKTFVVLKSGHYKTFVLSKSGYYNILWGKADTTNCYTKQRGYYKLFQSQKADTTKFANRSLTLVKAVSKYM